MYKNLADQNGFWSAKCWDKSENGQKPTVISSTAYAYGCELHQMTAQTSHLYGFTVMI